MLPVKAREERKYPHVTADLTWMRLIMGDRSHVVSEILCTPNPVQQASAIPMLAYKHPDTAAV